MTQNLSVHKSLPHNFIAEKMLLSSLLLEPELTARVSSQLSIDAFYFKNHRELYKILLYMTKNQLFITPFQLVAFLQTHGLLAQIGGTKVVLDLLNQVPNSVYAEEYMQIINEKFLRRVLIQMGYEIINSSYIETISSELVLKDLETKLFSLTMNTHSRQLPNTAILLENIFLELKKKFLNPQLPGLSSGFQNLDTITQGFQNADLIVIAGRPSTGKTALSLTIALNVIKESRLPVFFFSLEMSKEQIMYRILGMESNIDSQKLKTGQLSKNDWIKLNKLLKILVGLPFFVDDSPTISVDELRLKIKNIIFEQGKIGLVIIDYLQLIQNLTTQIGTRAEELSRITRALKMLAREFDIPIIFLSQLSRNIEGRVDQTPILSDLRESGSIEQDADLVLMLSQRKATIINSISENKVDLIIAKHRNGPTGTIRLKFNGKYTKFLEFIDQECPEPESNW